MEFRKWESVIINHRSSWSDLKGGRPRIPLRWRDDPPSSIHHSQRTARRPRVSSLSARNARSDRPARQATASVSAESSDPIRWQHLIVRRRSRSLVDSLEALADTNQSPESVDGALGDGGNSMDLSRIEFMATQDHVIVEGPTGGPLVKGIYHVTRMAGMALNQFRKYWVELHGSLGSKLLGCAATSNRISSTKPIYMRNRAATGLRSYGSTTRCVRRSNLRRARRSRRTGQSSSILPRFVAQCSARPTRRLLFGRPSHSQRPGPVTRKSECRREVPFVFSFSAINETGRRKSPTRPLWLFCAGTDRRERFLLVSSPRRNTKKSFMSGELCPCVTGFSCTMQD